MKPFCDFLISAMFCIASLGPFIFYEGNDRWLFASIPVVLVFAVCLTIIKNNSDKINELQGRIEDLENEKEKKNEFL